MAFYQKMNAISSYKGNEFAFAPMEHIIPGGETKPSPQQYQKPAEFYRKKQQAENN